MREATSAIDYQGESPNTRHGLMTLLVHKASEVYPTLLASRKPQACSWKTAVRQDYLINVLSHDSCLDSRHAHMRKPKEKRRWPELAENGRSVAVAQ